MSVNYSRLGAVSREMIEIVFDPIYHPPTAGSSAWRINTRTVHITLSVPSSLNAPAAFLARVQSRIAEPFAFVQQYVLLQRMTASQYIGEVPISLYLRSGADGQAHAFHQHFTFDRLASAFDEDNPEAMSLGRLQDPISQSMLFETDMFQATPYATNDMGIWSSL